MPKAPAFKSAAPPAAKGVSMSLKKPSAPSVAVAGAKPSAEVAITDPWADLKSKEGSVYKVLGVCASGCRVSIRFSDAEVKLPPPLINDTLNGVQRRNFFAKVRYGDGSKSSAEIAATGQVATTAYGKGDGYVSWPIKFSFPMDPTLKPNHDRAAELLAHLNVLDIVKAMVAATLAGADPVTWTDDVSLTSAAFSEYIGADKAKTISDEERQVAVLAVPLERLGVPATTIKVDASTL